MKKMRKLLSVFCMLCLMIPMLCGCMALDHMREFQAYYDSEGNILWNGTVYKKLPAGEYFCPETEDDQIAVTEEDVPVLLKDFFAEDRLYASEDKMILESYYGDYEGTQYYCREDQYEALSKRLQAPFRPEMVCYAYWRFDMEESTYVEEIYRLSDAQWDVLQKILEHVEPMEVGEGWQLSYDQSITLEECSEDRLFCREFLDLMCCGETYYLRLNTGRESFVYQVPEEAAPHVAEIMEAELLGYIQTEDVEEWIA